MKNLNLYTTYTTDELAYPTAENKIGTDSCALEVFTDFRKTAPLTVRPDLSALEAEYAMKETRARLRLVMDASHHFIGAISLDDLNPQEVIKRISSGYRRSELKVADFMRSKESLKAFSYDELTSATIGDVMDALEKSGYHHCLVADRDHHEIRGIISASDIASKLNLPLSITEKPNFATISGAIYHQIQPTGLHLVRAS